MARADRWVLLSALAALLLLFGWTHRDALAPPQRLASINTVPGASIADGGYLLDINTAAVDELDTLPGIGEVLAERIVAYREAHGPFPSVDALDHVDGIGEGTLAPIRRYLTAERPQTPKSCTQ